jgi:Fe2+ transport system protein FeoA
MVRKVESQSREVEDTLRALRRAAKRALELGLKTGTPVYVMENGKIVDLTKRKRSATRVVTRKAKTTRAKTSR